MVPLPSERPVVPDPPRDTGPRLIPLLLKAVLQGGHRYQPGIRHQAVLTRSGFRRLWTAGREHGRDMLERGAARLRFSHPHFDPDAAAHVLARILELSDGLERTYERLGDDWSRRAMLDVLTLRVLGAGHASLNVTPEAYRRQQAYADRVLRRQSSTFEVSDPYFSPLSLYAVPAGDGVTVTLHSHSVDVVSVFLLGQYTYAHGSHQVAAEMGDVVLDVGGCWGDTALAFASRVGGEGLVYTFEFDPESLEILRANLALNPQLDVIEVVQAALWSRSGEALEFVQAGRMTHVGPGGGGEASPLRVQTKTIDDFVAERALSRVDFIKIDVEGAELSVLEGAAETIRRFSPKLAVAAYHRDDDLVQIPAALADLLPSYRFYLESFSQFEDETVLFAVSDPATARSIST
jgi:FkbM family methyltransferase